MTVVDPWADVVGQERAMARLKAAAGQPGHAYLLVGPEGWGARPLVRAFAADVLAADLEGEEADRVRALAAAENHADLIFGEEPQGNLLREEDASQLIRFAHRHPTERPRKVIVVRAFNRATNKAYGMMLKVLEEPPASTIWMLLADEVTADMTTVASRAVRIELDPFSPDVIAARLEAEGHRTDAAHQAALVAGGDLDLARLLVGDERLAVRVEAWRRVPAQLDGTGHAVWRLVSELRTAVDDALAHVKAEFDAAERDLAARIDELKLPKGRLKELADSHKRRLRRARTAELRLGLSALAARYRDALATAPTGAERRALAAAVDAIDATYLAFIERNASEAIQLQSLFLRLPAIP